ncbi:MAG: hypothetical protein LBB81_06420 [Treponema sp.]|jgi:hypothetical protein|nr:hypothetical protein [Treponema sp.]
MRNKITFTTQTTQHGSFASLSKADNDLKKIKPETEDNAALLLSVFDNLNISSAIH